MIKDFAICTFRNIKYLFVVVDKKELNRPGVLLVPLSLHEVIGVLNEPLYTMEFTKDNIYWKNAYSLTPVEEQDKIQYVKQFSGQKRVPAYPEFSEIFLLKHKPHPVTCIDSAMFEQGCRTILDGHCSWFNFVYTDYPQNIWVCKDEYIAEAYCKDGIVHFEDKNGAFLKTHYTELSGWKWTKFIVPKLPNQ